MVGFVQRSTPLLLLGQHTCSICGYRTIEQQDHDRTAKTSTREVSKGERRSVGGGASVPVTRGGGAPDDTMAPASAGPEQPTALGGVASAAPDARDDDNPTIPRGGGGTPMHLGSGTSDGIGAGEPTGPNLPSKEAPTAPGTHGGGGMSVPEPRGGGKGRVSAARSSSVSSVPSSFESQVAEMRDLSPEGVRASREKCAHLAIPNQNLAGYDPVNDDYMSATAAVASVIAAPPGGSPNRPAPGVRETGASLADPGQRPEVGDRERIGHGTGGSASTTAKRSACEVVGSAHTTARRLTPSKCNEYCRAFPRQFEYYPQASDS